MDFFDENKTPKEKFFEILFNASRSVAIEELEKLFERMAILEVLAEECVEDVEDKIAKIKYEKIDEVNDMEESLYIETMAQILSKSV